MSRIFTSFLTPLLLAVLVSCATSAETDTESFLEKILRITGISATSSGMKGPGDEIETGDIWLANLDQKTRLRLTQDGVYRSPVFVPGDETILAVQHNAQNTTIVQISVFGGETTVLSALPGIVKLVGFSKDDRDKVLMLVEDKDGSAALGLLSLQNGQVTALPYDSESQEHRRILSHIKGWERIYGDTRVYLKTETKTDIAGRQEWTDVYIKQGKTAPSNVSKCDGINCAQPSLSHDGRKVVFIKQFPVSFAPDRGRSGRSNDSYIVKNAREPLFAASPLLP